MKPTHLVLIATLPLTFWAILQIVVLTCPAIPVPLDK